MDLPFPDRHFDLVFTSGLLIHINPGEINTAISEIHRCSRKYIWGFEYFNIRYVEVEYREARETSNLLWKGDFPQMFLDQFDNLQAVQVETTPHLRGWNVDIMYLLQKDTE